jgi:hypothetical protein
MPWQVQTLDVLWDEGGPQITQSFNVGWLDPRIGHDEDHRGLLVALVEGGYANANARLAEDIEKIQEQEPTRDVSKLVAVEFDHGLGDGLEMISEVGAGPPGRWLIEYRERGSDTWEEWGDYETEDEANDAREEFEGSADYFRLRAVENRILAGAFGDEPIFQLMWSDPWWAVSSGHFGPAFYVEIQRTLPRGSHEVASVLSALKWAFPDDDRLLQEVMQYEDPFAGPQFEQTRVAYDQMKHQVLRALRAWLEAGSP